MHAPTEIIAADANAPQRPVTAATPRATKGAGGWNGRTRSCSGYKTIAGFDRDGVSASAAPHFPAPGGPETYPTRARGVVTAWSPSPAGRTKAQSSWPSAHGQALKRRTPPGLPVGVM